MSFRFYFAGGESPVWKKALTNCGVSNLAISFANLRPRLPKTKPYVIADRFDDGLNIMLDSGGFAANKKSKNVDALKAYFDQYAAFVTLNIDRLSLVTEFDIFGYPDLVEEWRKGFWKDIPAHKFVPVWHSAYGSQELERLASTYPNLAVVSNTEIRSQLNSVITRHGVKLHATMSKPDDVVGIRYASASSSSWTSPMRFGETHIWDGNRLRRYPMAYKDRRRAQHRKDFTAAGFDAEKIVKDDYDEVTRYTIFAWMQLEEWMGRRRGSNHPSEGEKGQVVDIKERARGRSSGQRGGTAVATRPRRARKDELTSRRDRTTLPVMGSETRSSTNPQDGSTIDIEVPTIRKEAVRVCDSCYIQHACPEFKPGSECAFEIPVRITTKDELIDTLVWMLEIQTQRVMFARYVEEKQGGYPDKNLSDEMDRMFRMTEKLNDLRDNRESLDIKYRGSSGGGLVSKIFGADIGHKARELPEPLDAHGTGQLMQDFIDVSVGAGDDEEE